MLSRLDSLLFVDAQTRWRVIWSSALAVAVTGACGEILGLSVVMSQAAALSVGAAVLTFQICRAIKPKMHGTRLAQEEVMDRVVKENLSQLTSSLAVLTVFAVAYILIAAAAPTLRAQALNRRLYTALASVPGPRKISEVKRILKDASTTRTTLRSDLMMKAQSQLDEHDPTRR